MVYVYLHLLMCPCTRPHACSRTCLSHAHFFLLGGVVASWPSALGLLNAPPKRMRASLSLLRITRILPVLKQTDVPHCPLSCWTAFLPSHPGAAPGPHVALMGMTVEPLPLEQPLATSAFQKWTSLYSSHIWWCPTDWTYPAASLCLFVCLFFWDTSTFYFFLFLSK
jgi:hypothetical protein